MTDTIETGDPIRAAGTDRLYRLRIERDDRSGMPSPREGYDHHLGVMAAYHRHYILPQEDDTNRHQGHTGAWLAAQLDERRTGGTPDGLSFRAVSRWLRMFHGATVVLPIYMSGNDDRLVAGAADDDGEAACGLIYDTPGTRTKCYGSPDPAPSVHGERVDIAAVLAAEVDAYTAWARGEMAQWVVECCELPGDDVDSLGEAVDQAAGLVERLAAVERYDAAIAAARGDYDAASADLAWEVVDSCSGYYSLDEARECGRPELLAIVQHAEREAAEKAAERSADEEEIRSMVSAELNRAAG